MIAVLTPTTAPALVTSGPPELPGLSAASVWMTCSIRRPVRARSDPAERADHAARHGVLEAIRVADRNRQLTWFERLRIAELDRGEIGRRDTDHGDVGVAVLADEIGGALTAVGERDVDRGRAVNDVAVREDEPVAREDKPGAAARLGARPLAVPGALTLMLTTAGATRSTAWMTARE